MGIMTRIVRICKADVHGVMDQLEDKRLLLKQYMREMESSLEQKERRIDDLTEKIDRLTDRMLRYQEETGHLQRDLDSALKTERDDISRLLIRKRRILENSVEETKDRLEMMTREKTAVSERVHCQRLQYETLKVKAETYHHNAMNFFETQESDPCTLPPEYGGGISDEEVELELLQRKEALQKKGEFTS